MPIRRRKLLLSATAAAAAVPLPVPAIAQGVKELKLVTSWPKGTVGLQTSAERFARSIAALSDGRLNITVYSADTLVRSLEVFDAVGAGVADMYHSTDYYFAERSPALNSFAPYLGSQLDQMTA